VLIDAGGYIEVFLVAGGSGGFQDQATNGGQGGEAQIKKMYLTSTNPITVTIGAGGLKAAWNTVPSAIGGNSVFSGAAAGGITFTSVGGILKPSSEQVATMISPGWGARSDGTYSSSPGPGVNGYGMGGGTFQSVGAYAPATKPNSGHGGVSGSNTSRSTDGGSGYCLIKWYE